MHSGATVSYTHLDVYKRQVHVLRRERPDLLLLDLMLPGRDGWDITRLVRACLLYTSRCV